MDGNLDRFRTITNAMSPDEISNYYTRWANDMKYDQDLRTGIYNAPRIVAEEVARHFSINRDTIKIIDIACGTGRVGDELAAYGFKDFDGLDPSVGMLSACKKKGLYKKLYKEYCCGKTVLSIDDDVYDCLVVSGGMGASHIPNKGLVEMKRIIKPGGLIIVVMRKEFKDRVGADIENLETFVANMEREKKIRVLEKREVKRYTFDRDGILFTIQKL